MEKAPTPWWIKVIIVLAMMPVLMFPALLSTAPADGEARIFLWFYPAYVIASGICAWISYRQRPEITWILIVLLILTHIAMYLLVNPLPPA